MTPIEIPVASPAVRVVMGVSCLFVALVLFALVVPNFRRFLRAAFGNEPGLKKPAKPIIGILLYLLTLGIAFVPLVVFVELVRNPLTTISEDGISQEGTLVRGRTSVRWGEISRVSCVYARNPANDVGTLIVLSQAHRKIIIGNAGRGLNDVYQIMQERVAAGVVEPCTHPSPSTH